MSLLKKIKRNSLTMALNESIFTTPFFRRAFGQYPYDVEIVTLKKNKLGENLRKALSQKNKPFVVIVRNKDEDIDDVFFVPILKEGKNVRVLRPHEVAEPSLVCCE